MILSPNILVSNLLFKRKILTILYLEFKQFFKRRRYSNKIINNGFDRAINTTRSDALLPESRATDDLKNLILVMDYHPNFRDIPKLIKDHLSILYESPRMKKVCNSNKTCIRTGFRKTKKFERSSCSLGTP